MDYLRQIEEDLVGLGNEAKRLSSIIHSYPYNCFVKKTLRSERSDR
jgi:hypothetical protein